MGGEAGESTERHDVSAITWFDTPVSFGLIRAYLNPQEVFFRVWFAAWL